LADAPGSVRAKRFAVSSGLEVSAVRDIRVEGIGLALVGEIEVKFVCSANGREECAVLVARRSG
jgi:hypothetical protein